MLRRYSNHHLIIKRYHALYFLSIISINCQGQCTRRPLPLLWTSTEWKPPSPSTGMQLSCIMLFKYVIRIYSGDHELILRSARSKASEGPTDRQTNIRKILYFYRIRWALETNSSKPGLERTERFRADRKITSWSPCQRVALFGSVLQHPQQRVDVRAGDERSGVANRASYTRMQSVPVAT